MSLCHGDSELSSINTGRCDRVLEELRSLHDVSKAIQRGRSRVTAPQKLK